MEKLAHTTLSGTEPEVEPSPTELNRLLFQDCLIHVLLRWATMAYTSIVARLQNDSVGQRQFEDEQHHASPIGATANDGNQVYAQDDTTLALLLTWLRLLHFSSKSTIST